MVQNLPVKSRVNEVDLLRFLAVMGVVFFHYAFRGHASDGMSIMPYPLAPIAKYGYFGVHLFFIISGFVIMLSASSGNLRRFVVARIVRLYPAFWICCTTTFVFILVMGAPRYTASFSQYLLNMTMMSGFWGVKSIDGVYWSLFIELRFYSLVCLVLAIGQIERAEILMAIWLLAAIVLVVRPIYPLYDWLIIDYAVYFIAGATFFAIWSKGLSIARFGMIILSLALALHQTILAMPNYEKWFQTRINNSIVAIIIITFFILMLAISLKYTSSFGRRQWLLAGAITYPLYLLHQNIGFMIFNAAYPAVDSHLIFWGTITLAIGAAFAVHVWVEKPVSLQLRIVIEKSIDSLHRFNLHITDQIRKR
jgi:peptidoglycan/LPS O-acetylase OafA/YrhL